MSWQEGVAVTVVLIGLGAGAFLVAQRPTFWIGFGARLWICMFTSRASIPQRLQDRSLSALSLLPMNISSNSFVNASPLGKRKQGLSA